MNTNIERNENIKVFLFGSFEVEINGKKLSSAHWKSKKALTIFKYLLFKHDKKVQKDILIDMIWHESTGDQTQTLHTTIYYLRRALKNLLGEENSDFIKCSKGLYWLEEADEFWIDVVEFENDYKKGLYLHNEGNLKKAFELFEEALSLYRGDLLVEDLYEDWTFNQRQYYKEIYIDLILRSASIVAEKEENYLYAAELCQRGLKIDPYREELHQLLLSYLIKAEMYMDVVKNYHNYSRMLFEEFDLKPGNQIKDIIINLAGEGDHQKIVNTYFNQKSLGAFLCDKITFDLIYELNIRRQERSEEKNSMLSLFVPEERGNTKKVLDILHKSLRQGDVICQWDKEYILVLLYRAGNKETELVKNRLRKRFKNSVEEIHMDSWLISDSNKFIDFKKKIG